MEKIAAVMGESEAADREAKEAEAAVAAVMGFATLQTGDGAKAADAETDAKAARTAATAADTAYKAAKREYDKAATATSLIAVSEAEEAGDAEKMKVEAQAKIAATKAASAKEAAKMAMGGLTVDGMTYSSGGVSIRAGSPKVETTPIGGKTTVTGFVGNVMSSAFTKREKVKYVAGTNGKRAEPAIEKRDLMVGTYTDDEDDGFRLWLIDKYASTKEVWIYRYVVGVSGVSTVETTAKIGAESDIYGKVTLTDVDGNGNDGKVKIHRASGELYEEGDPKDEKYFDPMPGSSVSDTDESRVSASTISGSQQDDNKLAVTGLYYIVMPDNTNESGFSYQGRTLMAGDRVWLKLTKTVINKQGSGDNEYTFDVVSVYETKNFPVEKSYEHINYGVWHELKDDGDTPAGMGIGFVNTLAGKSMTMSSGMPDTGTATYNGLWVATVRGADMGDISVKQGGAVTMADFGKDTITVDLKDRLDDTMTIAKLEGSIDGSGFKGTKITGVTDKLGVKASSDGSDYTGTFSGAFFGPDAPEVGGVFDYRSAEGKKAGEFRGAFGGGKR